MKRLKLLWSWRVWAGAAVVAGAVLLIWLAVRWSGGPDRILAERRGPNGELTRDQVERLLSSVERDEANDAKRTRYSLALGTGVLHNAFYKMVEAAFPNRNTYGKFVHAGRAASGSLLAVVLDQNAALARRENAASIAAEIDPYGTLKAIQQPIARGQIAGRFAWLVAGCCLPDHGAPWSAYSQQALISDFASKSVDDMCLERLDTQISDVNLAPNDRPVLWWLNRYRGVDFDDYLAKQSPETLALRKREIERGCDPVRLVFWLVGIDEDLKRRLYPDRSDQAAMMRLWQICCSHSTPREGDWHAAFLQWYNANRSRLVYDAKVMHFVVGAKPVRPEVHLESTGTLITVFYD